MDDGTILLLGLGLLAAGLLLVVAELFIPSGGLIAIGAGAAAISGIVVLFRHNDPWWGFIGIGLVLIGTPISLNLALKIWPSTPVGRRMLMGDTTEADLEAKRAAELEARERRRALVGAEGEVVSPLRPVGIVRIGDARHDALAESGIIEPGQRIRVTAVTDNQLKVRAI
ncbi:MAG: NfeD family protein [Phycisphaerales bacterium JB041]